MLRDESHLARRRTRSIDDQRGFYERLRLQSRDDVASRLVIADHADEDAARSKRSDVARNVAGAADRDFAALDRQHRRGRLRRDAPNLAVDELVEHEIADA